MNSEEILELLYDAEQLEKKILGYIKENHKGSLKEAFLKVKIHEVKELIEGLEK